MDIEKILLEEARKQSPKDEFVKAWPGGYNIYNLKNEDFKKDDLFYFTAVATAESIGGPVYQEMGFFMPLSEYEKRVAILQNEERENKLNRI